MKINPDIIFNDVKRALQEDIGSGDITAGLLNPLLHAKASLISREPMVVCGQPWVNETCQQVDTRLVVTWHVDEGQHLKSPSTLCTIDGPAHSILTAERTALNFLQTLSATATKTQACVALIEGYKTQILDTRKTLPGLRYAQKYAVYVGGGVNHRMGLYDAFLIKENHIKAHGSIKKVIEAARRAHPEKYLEIEVENLQELQEAIDAKPDRIMLDNFSMAMLEEAVQINHASQCLLEVSGGVEPSRLIEIAKTGVDYISMGALTKSIEAIDLSLLIRETDE